MISHLLSSCKHAARHGGWGGSYANCAVTRVCTKTVGNLHLLLGSSRGRGRHSLSLSSTLVQICPISYLPSPITQIIHSRYLSAPLRSVNLEFWIIKNERKTSILPRNQPLLHFRVDHPSSIPFRSCFFFSSEAVCPSSALRTDRPGSGLYLESDLFSQSPPLPTTTLSRRRRRRPTSNLS